MVCTGELYSIESLIFSDFVYSSKPKYIYILFNNIFPFIYSDLLLILGNYFETYCVEGVAMIKYKEMAEVSNKQMW